MQRLAFRQSCAHVCRVKACGCILTSSSPWQQCAMRSLWAVQYSMHTQPSQHIPGEAASPGQTNKISVSQGFSITQRYDMQQVTAFSAISETSSCSPHV